jgi:hypothetical protein
MIGIQIEVPGGTREQYDRVQAKLGGTLPEGRLSHAAGPCDGGWRVSDVWESENAFQQFFRLKLFGALQECGVSPFRTRPFPVHDAFRG